MSSGNTKELRDISSQKEKLLDVEVSISFTLNFLDMKNLFEQWLLPFLTALIIHKYVQYRTGKQNATNLL